MPEEEKVKTAPDKDGLISAPAAPLVFISHDGRDADLAEAFSKLLRSVSAGMIKTFRSSDKKGNEGIDFGDEWYRRLMSKLQATSDVVCLFTERSLDRPWILFEAGVAKGKLGTPVIGIALGVPLNRVTTGPFYQFQNMDDSEGDLIRLVNQLARRVQNLELDADVVKGQVQAFKATEASLLKNAATSNRTKPAADGAEDTAVAKLVEEMKSLPSRVAERLAEEGAPVRWRKRRRFHPMMFEEMMHMAGEPGDPVTILMAAGLIRDDAPWLYELAMEVYRAVKRGNISGVRREIDRLRHLSEMMRRGPMMTEFADRDSHVIAIEFPRMLEHMLQRILERGGASGPKGLAARQRLAKPEAPAE